MVAMEVCVFASGLQSKHPDCPHKRQLCFAQDPSKQGANSRQRDREPILVDFAFLQVDPLVQLMKVEKTPDSTYEMIGGVDKQIKDRGVAASPSKHSDFNRRCMWSLGHREKNRRLRRSSSSRSSIQKSLSP